eukprot:6184508-Pleurochrysis_carterae.AAC.3
MRPPAVKLVNYELCNRPPVRSDVRTMCTTPFSTGPSPHLKKMRYYQKFTSRSQNRSTFLLISAYTVEVVQL